MNKEKREALVGILLLLLLGCAAMAVVDSVIRPSYGVKSAVKWVFFLVFPLLLSVFRKDLSLKRVFIPSKSGFLLALVLGLGVYGVILGAYFLLRGIFDFSGITGLLGENVGVDQDNFLLVALYISFANSLLEEFFFRGFAFLLLKAHVSRAWAHGISAVAFALYHVAIMIGWFSPALFCLAMLGLTVGGLIFNFLDEKQGNLYCSWMVHMFANFAINTVGCILFGIL